MTIMDIIIYFGLMSALLVYLFFLRRRGSRD
jgi:hypothetical protein